MGYDENRMSINLVAAVFVAVSILKAFKTEDLSRKLEVNYVKFQFRGGLLGSYIAVYSSLLDCFVRVLTELLLITLVLYIPSQAKRSILGPETLQLIIADYESGGDIAQLKMKKCHFKCREGIISHKVLKSGIEVDRAKVDVIAKLPHPTTVKGVRSFLGHAGFYQRFIQDLSKIARPMTHLLEKEIPFVFSKDCIDAFQTLKKKLTEAPILVVPDWNLPSELMCDASDFAIGAVLGQQKTKHFQPIHYASKTMTEAQILLQQPTEK
ncbi:reverse transcriptase domain-containing protein [Tanacetum coccineum]